MVQGQSAGRSPFLFRRFRRPLETLNSSRVLGVCRLEISLNAKLPNREGSRSWDETVWISSRFVFFLPLPPLLDWLLPPAHSLSLPSISHLPVRRGENIRLSPRTLPPLPPQPTHPRLRRRGSPFGRMGTGRRSRDRLVEGLGGRGREREDERQGVESAFKG